MLKMLMLFVVFFMAGCTTEVVHHYAECPEWADGAYQEYRLLKRENIGYNNLIYSVEQQQRFCKYLETW